MLFFGSCRLSCKSSSPPGSTAAHATGKIARAGKQRLKHIGRGRSSQPIH